MEHGNSSVEENKVMDDFLQCTDTELAYKWTCTLFKCNERRMAKCTSHPPLKPYLSEVHNKMHADRFWRLINCERFKGSATTPKWGQSSEVNDNRDNHFANRCILATWRDLWTGGRTLSFLADSDVKAQCRDFIRTLAVIRTWVCLVA